MPLTKRIGVWTTFVICAGCAGGGGQNPVGPPDPFKVAQQNATHDAIQSYSQVGATGTIVQVVCPQGKWLAAFGAADLNGAPMRPDMQFRIASITKLFTAAAVLQLIDQGLVHPNDHIADYLDNPSKNISSEDWNEITIEELANHTSGLSKKIIDDPTKPWTPEELLANVKLDYAPGSKYNYSNANYIVLGMLITKVNHADASFYIFDHFITRLGIGSTLFPASGTQPHLMCWGYTSDRFRDVTDLNPSWSSYAGEMVSTASDLTTWIRALFGNSLLSPQSESTLTHVVSTGPPPTAFGVQVFNRWFGHTGRNRRLLLSRFLQSGYRCECCGYGQSVRSHRRELCERECHPKEGHRRLLSKAPLCLFWREYRIAR